MINKPKFYDAIRHMFDGGLLSVQVKVIDALIDGAEKLTDYELAYIMATAYGEAKFTPQRENMNYSASRIRKVWPKRPEAVKFAHKPKDLANCVYNGRLGNRIGSNDGWDYRGGGVDQLTGRDNYNLVGLVAIPNAILEPETAVKSIIHGMTTGRYTGKALRDYVKPDGFDFIGARAIVNDDVNVNGKLYAGYAETFLKAIRANTVGEMVVTPAVDVPDIGGLTAFIKAILRLLGIK